MNVQESIIPPIDFKYLNVVEWSLECLTFLYMIRGLADAAAKVTKLLLRFINAQIENSGSLSSTEISNLLTTSIRADAVSSSALMANSTTEKERTKAIELCTTAQKKTRDNPDADVHPDIVVLLCVAFHAVSLGQFIDASGYFHSAAQYALLEGCRARQCLAKVGKAWCSFLSGHRSIAQTSIEKVLNYAVSVSHVPLHLWALELDLLMKIFVTDFDGAEDTQRLIRSLARKGNPMDPDQRKDNYNACTSAVIAYYYTVNDMHERAIPHALYACTKLSSRKQCLAFGGVLLFCAAYSAMEVLMFRKGLIQRSKSMDDLYGAVAATATSSLRGTSGSSKLHSLRSSGQRKHSSLLGANRRQSGNPQHDTKTANVITGSYSNKRVYEKVKLAMESLSQHALRFPSLYPLVWVLSIKYLMLERTFTRATLIDLDFKIKGSLSALAQFVFADAFLHLERTKLCLELRVSPDFHRVGDSRQIAKICFNKLGNCPYDLNVLLASPDWNTSVKPPENEVDSNGSALGDDYEDEY